MREATPEKLKKLLPKWASWEAFEDTDDGNIEIFSMRVGTHLGRPTQAVMAEGHFLKIRARPDFAGYQLKRLDPSNPDECLYPPRANKMYIPSQAKLWRPKNTELNLSDLASATLRSRTAALVNNLTKSNALLQTILKGKP